MVEEGKKLLACMNNSYGIEPKVEHYGCVIDLLSRAGLLEEAVELIESMPMELNSNAWGALRGSCRIHGNIEVGEKLCANIYAAGKRWDDARKVRKLMKNKKVAKLPGVSMIELKGMVHRFVASDRSHPESDKIYEKLSEITTARLKLHVGYSPDG